MTDESSDFQSRYHELKQQFRAGLPARLEHIHTLGYHWLDAESQAASGDDFQTLVHNLAGSAGSYGFPEITLLCQKIEVAILENDMASKKTIRTWLDQLLVFIK